MNVQALDEGFGLPFELRVISRIWHGWTDRANGDAYEEMLGSVALSRFDERVMHYETILAPD